LNGLCSEQKYQVRRDPSAYYDWQVAAVRRVAQVLGCKNDLHAVRAACATLMGVGVEVFSGMVEVTVSGGSEPLNFVIPRFLSQGFVEEGDNGRPISAQALAADVAALLSHLEKNPPKKGVTAGACGSRGHKRMKSGTRRS
jgi:hypothetical protein